MVRGNKSGAGGIAGLCSGGGDVGVRRRRGDYPKLDKHLNGHASKGGTTKVIVILKPGWSVDTETKKLGGKLGRSLGLINGKVVELSNGQLKKLADYAGVERIVYDRPTAGELNRVAVTVGARAVQQSYGYRGAGVGVAVIDSGITSWHADLSYLGSSSLVRTSNGQRVAAFVDLINGRTAPYDDNGHGTHVSGIIAGNGFDALGSRAGVAPDAHIVSLKVLDAQGRGVISNVIAALDWVVRNRAAYNVRVVNLSVGAAVTESYKTDPLTLAAKRAVDAGIVVVTAAGNLGKNRLGQLQDRSHRGAGQRALGFDRRCVEPPRHRRPSRRCHGRLQLTWPLGTRLRGEAGHRCPWRRNGVTQRSAQPHLRNEGLGASGRIVLAWLQACTSASAARACRPRWLPAALH